MSFRRDPSAPRLALPLLALLLGFGSASVPARSLDLGNLVREGPNLLVSRLSALFGFWEEDTTSAPPAEGTQEAGTEGGGSADAGIVIDPNGAPKT